MSEYWRRQALVLGLMLFWLGLAAGIATLLHIDFNGVVIGMTLALASRSYANELMSGK